MPEILDSQANLADLLEHIPIPAALISLESGECVAVNSALGQLSKYGQDIADLLLSLVLDQQPIQQLQQGKIIRDCQLEIPISHNQACTFLLSAKLVGWRGDHYIFCVFQDVTGYKQQKLTQPEGKAQNRQSSGQVANSLDQFSESRQFLDWLLTSSPFIFYIYDLDRQTMVYGNQQSWQTLDAIKQFLGDRPSCLQKLAQGQTHDFCLQSRWWRSYHTPWQIDSAGVVHQVAGVAIDITAQKQAEQALAESEQRQRAISQVIPDQIMRWHRDGTCLECLSPTPSHSSEILPPPLLPKLLEAIATALDERSLQVYEQETNKSGKLCLEEVRVVAVGAEEVLVSVRDISDRYIASQTRQELAEAMQITHLQRRFFAMLSHEFRTPLSTILGSVELLQHSHAQWLDDKAKRNLNRIAVSVQDALELLENMLTLSRADAGNLQVKPQYINLRRFTEELVDSITTERQIVMHFKTSGEDYMGYTDPFLLRRLLVNLLNNAIKYSADDTEIRVFLMINMEQDQAIWQVIDRGIGIRSAELEQIFLPWKRGSNTDHTRGTGLGLSVVQNCVNAIGGVISVLSKENVGTTFTVIVPIAGADHV